MTANEHDIEIDELGDNITDDEIKSLVGAVVHIPVGGEIPPEGAAWDDFFRFARVLTVTSRNWWRSKRCPICETKRPRYILKVEWEADYEFEDGNLLCEHCIVGIVTKGHEYIAFGDEQRPSRSLSIATKIDLTK